MWVSRGHFVHDQIHLGSGGEASPPHASTEADSGPAGAGRGFESHSASVEEDRSEAGSVLGSTAEGGNSLLLRKGVQGIDPCSRWSESLNIHCPRWSSSQTCETPAGILIME